MTDFIFLQFLGKQKPLKAKDWGAAQEDTHGPLCLAAQTQKLATGDASISPDPCYTSGTPSFGSLAFFYGDGLLLDDINFPQQDLGASARDHYSNFSTLQTSPSSYQAIDRVSSILPSSLPSSSLSSQPLARSGSITSTGQGLFDVGFSPRSDFLSPSLGIKAGGRQSPLHIAARKGYDRIARILLQHDTDCNEKDSDGLTPIMYAVIAGHEDVVRSLLLHGARIGNVDGHLHSSALHWAAQYRRETLLRVLLNHCLGERTLIDSYDDLGRTPLHVAVDAEFEPGVLILLQFGANPQYATRKS